MFYSASRSATLCSADTCGGRISLCRFCDVSRRGEPRESVIVFIGDELPEEKIRAGFEAMVG
ncbi:GTP-binding protein [Pseudomonas viridiflava]|uniref:GTP-binding protein n=1 Tax=Pseudomonas viridiflava TaxID=33069 RepID=UPI001E3D039C|nr:GTP-binding protein [Pseudomonas viridiflava]MEE3927451.1 GTP-binding protein [Pseudomonas viridiflava]MEE3933507.1 GTP-binding protein [Pseudomonas viridiflava]MEE3942191.1 GTP-binding protein [Pseudomonas viridiflava]MEE3970434.1 GTP-binding protein [Pseudomonas viridiflava]MEE3984801.1 GTP-binding protein [Pseudomonas viridiflava]